VKVRQPGDDRPPHWLTGWTLVMALAVIASTAIATLLITGSPEAVTIVLAPLLLLLGVSATR
jgi:hypothetical protein